LDIQQGQQVIIRTQFRRYHGLVLGINPATGRARVATKDDVLERWETYTFDVARLSPLKAKAPTAVAISA
jgi:hypothetical protein